LRKLSKHLKKNKKIRPSFYRKEISKSEFYKIINKEYDGFKAKSFMLVNDDSDDYDLLIFNYKNGKKEIVAFIGLCSGGFKIFNDIDSDIDNNTDNEINKFINNIISNIDSIYLFGD
jgi:hypothetical protein